jgi:hypothetical protein
MRVILSVPQFTISKKKSAIFECACINVEFIIILADAENRAATGNMAIRSR